MAVNSDDLFIVTYPDPILRKKTSPLEAVTDEVRAVAAKMIELMRDAAGIGLAAPQVGLPWRMFVAEVPLPEDAQAGPEATEGVIATEGPRVYVNPALSSPIGAPEPHDEGCLSIPEVTGRVFRPPIITVTALDLEGATFTQTASGLLARCVQHEIDHLDGVLILDRMDQMSRLKNRSAVRALERQAGQDARRTAGSRRR